MRPEEFLALVGIRAVVAVHEEYLRVRKVSMLRPRLRFHDLRREIDDEYNGSRILPNAHLQLRTLRFGIESRFRRAVVMGWMRDSIVLIIICEYADDVRRQHDHAH